MTGKQEHIPKVTIYTDGACSPNPGPGGWGAVMLLENSRPLELSGFGGETTNNRMELTAVLEALKSLDRPHRITIFTDSQYVKNGITSWIEKWQVKNWQTADKKPVKNKELWIQLLQESDKHQLTWKWVRGHSADKWNERADELAVAARKKQQPAANQVEAKQVSGPSSEDCIHMYTGVTCKHSTGVGAWCLILCWKHHVKIMGQRTTDLTANQLYIKAVINGLSTLKKPFPVIVHTHSGYLRDGAVSWLEGWKKRNWQTREGTPVSNRNLWQELAALLDRFDVTFHLDDKENPLCLMLEAKELAREYELETP